MRIVDVLKVLALACALAAGVAEVEAAALFAPVAGRPADPPRATIRQRLMRLDAAVLGASLLPPGSESAPDRAARAAAARGAVTIDLFAGRAVTCRYETATALDVGGLLWSGTGAGGDSCLVVVRGGRVTAAVDTAHGYFLIDPVGEGALHRLREIDAEGFRRDVHRHVPKPRAARRVDVPPAPAAATTTVTLLATYTVRARRELGDPAAKIALDVGIVNRAMRRSGVPITVQLLQVKALSSSYDETTREEPLDDITANPGSFPTIHSRRNRLRADLVTMYAAERPYCGIAWVLQPPFWEIDEAYGFSVIDADCAGGRTLAHELGHNLGLLHDRFVEPAAPASEYGYGYVSVAGRFMDIMAYPDLCRSKGLTCTQLFQYSTPSKTYRGLPTGIAQGRRGAADGVRALRENRSHVAGYR